MKKCEISERLQKFQVVISFIFQEEAFPRSFNKIIFGTTKKGFLTKKLFPFHMHEYVVKFFFFYWRIMIST